MSRNRLLILAAICLAAGIAVAVAVLMKPPDNGAGQPQAAGPRKPAASRADRQRKPVVHPATVEPARDESKLDFDALQGQWERPDGGYVLDVRRADPEGKLDAGYFNPERPIRVAKAQAKKEGGQIKVFVELRDTNYPGCTYDLVYDPKQDCLVGKYYQAAVQETYEIVFVRRR